MTANQNSFGFACEEVRHPVGELDIEAQIDKFSISFMGCIKSWAEVNKQHPNVAVVIFQVCDD